MIEVNRKYFGYIGRFINMDCKNYFWAIEINGKEVKGVHIFIGKIYISIYIRIGIRK